MADRVYPSRDSPPSPTSAAAATEDNKQQTTTSTTVQQVQPKGTSYVVQIPKDQIYRYPPPENERLYQKYTHRKNHRRNPCCCCLCWIIGIIFILILLSAIFAGVFYFVFQPKALNYTVNSLSIKGINLKFQPKALNYTVNSLSIKGINLKSSSSDTVVIDVTVKAQNPNKKIGIYYEKESYVAVSHSGITLCSGSLPNFYQPTGNVTVFKTTLKGSSSSSGGGGGGGLRLKALDKNALIDEQKKGKIPLGLDLKVPVKIKVGSVKTWTITVKVHCDLTVDKLTVDSKIVSKKCGGVGLKLWKD